MIVLRFAKNIKALTIGIVNTVRGIFTYGRTGTSSPKAYDSFVSLYCLTQGYSNSFLSWLLKLRHPLYTFPNTNGILGNLATQKIDAIAQVIKEDGYYIFDRLLPGDICERLTSFALTKECNLVGTADSKLNVSIYNSDNPIAITYWLKEEDLIANPDIQNLMTDLSILAIAQAYLETPPILDIVAMWWSTAMSKNASSESAQLYHFDLDRIKWLKFFIYLTDVTSDNGPHCYVSGSHQPGNKPEALVRRGYSRIPDEDIAKFYPQSKCVEITAPKGTIIAGDTSCFHKGKPVQNGERLILELEFTNSLFGASYSKNLLIKAHDSSMSQMFLDYPRSYLKFFS
jgi:Phytanoyl-CoA dioxygenase (PhyH)